MLHTNDLHLSQACEGVILHKTAAGIGHNTLASYRNSYRILLSYFESDPPFASITKTELVAFFAWLQNDYISEPDGVAPRGKFKLGTYSIFNIHTACSILWGWGVEEEYVEENIIRKIPAPKLKTPVIETFTRDEIELLLKACDRTFSWKERPATTTDRPTALRDKTIILTLLSTGIRASELCSIHIGDLNMTNNSIKILGKGNKERFIFFGKRTAKFLWKLSTARIQVGAGEKDPLFTVGKDGDPLERKVLRRLLKRIGDRAGVKRVYPHRFRHTFATNYLRNGGDLLTLQTLLGHSSLEMVKRYARVVAADCAVAHERADPVDNWKL